MIRAVLFSAFVAAWFAIWMEKPATKYYPGQGEIPLVPISQIDFCPINYRAAYKDIAGWHFIWAGGYGPCSLQDEYRNI